MPGPELAERRQDRILGHQTQPQAKPHDLLSSDAVQQVVGGGVVGEADHGQRHFPQGDDLLRPGSENPGLSPPVPRPLVGATVGSRPVPPFDLRQRDRFGRLARPGGDGQGEAAERDDLSDGRQRVPAIRVDRNLFGPGFDHDRAESGSALQGLLEIHPVRVRRGFLSTESAFPHHGRGRLRGCERRPPTGTGATGRTGPGRQRRRVETPSWPSEPWSAWAVWSA